MTEPSKQSINQTQGSLLSPNHAKTRRNSYHATRQQFSLNKSLSRKLQNHDVQNGIGSDFITQRSFIPKEKLSIGSQVEDFQNTLKVDITAKSSHLNNAHQNDKNKYQPLQSHNNLPKSIGSPTVHETAAATNILSNTNNRLLVDGHSVMQKTIMQTVDSYHKKE